jgi:hypothetical protein
MDIIILTFTLDLGLQPSYDSLALVPNEQRALKSG